MRAFEYKNPGNLDEAIGFLNAQSRALAGGTDLVTLMKADIASPSRLVNIKSLLDADIGEGPAGTRLGALVTLDDLEKSLLIQGRYTALAEAAAAAASPQLRNMATLGGNLLQRPRCWYYRNARIPCWLKGGDACPAKNGENRLHALFGDSPCVAVHPSDPASALVALDAQLRVRGGSGERVVPIEQFFALPHASRRTENSLEDDELIVAIELPARQNLRSTYLKAMERKTWTFALVGVAAAVRRAGPNIEEARVVLTGVAPVPWRAHLAEEVLKGARPQEGLFEEAARAALEGASPLGHNAYKIPLLTALVRRALATVCVIS